MRVLSIHNEYLIRGGEEESRKAEIEILRKNGIEVIEYTENNRVVDNMSKLRLAIRTIWSSESYQNVCKILKHQKIDIIHVQNIFPLISPSIYYAAKSFNIPVIQAVRNYRNLCINSYLYREGHICESCLAHKYPISGVINKCYRNSYSASIVAASTQWFHNYINSRRHINFYLCISEFVKNKMVEGGFPSNKLIVKPNFVYPDPGYSPYKDNFILYVGRLSSEKGINILLDSLKNLKTSNLTLKIIGEGDVSKLIETYIGKGFRIELLGRLSISDTYDIIGNSSALIIPSEWNEPFGRVIVEAFAKGTPVIGANVGGITELIEDGVNGFLFKNGDSLDLAKKIDYLFENKDRINELGLAGRSSFLQYYTSEVNYRMLMEIYSRVLL